MSLLAISPWDLFIAVWTVIGMASAEELSAEELKSITVKP